METKTYVVGDIHGSCKALIQCLQRAQFNYEIDHLIALGDICDGYPETKECIDELMKIKNLKLVRGNHDEWSLAWMMTGETPSVWTGQGGKATIKSFKEIIDVNCHLLAKPENIDSISKYRVFLNNSVYYLEWRNKLFVHGGIVPGIPVYEQNKDELMWDRELCEVVVTRQNYNKEAKINGYDDIFVGHTTTECYGSLEPIHACNVWMLDTGAGWGGKLTIMNVDTYQYWQSDCSKDLYKDESGRA